MKIVTEYYSVSGFGDADCMFLGKRFNEKWGYKPYEGECWAMLKYIYMQRRRLCKACGSFQKRGWLQC